MRFKSQIRNVSTFEKICTSLSTLSPLAWLKLSSTDVRMTVIPERGSQVWSQLKIDSIFDTYIIQSAAPNDQINLEVPIQALGRALKSAAAGNARDVGMRLTKKDGVPMLSLTIVSQSLSSGNQVVSKISTRVVAEGHANEDSARDDEFSDFDFDDADFDDLDRDAVSRERETIITQDVPVKVLAMNAVEGLHEPRVQEPDVHIYLPPLGQVKSISERFTRLALASKGIGTNNAATSPRLEISANMHGSLRIRVKTDALAIDSMWTGLLNPELDPSHYTNGSQAVREHPSTRMKELGGPNGESDEGWSNVRIDGKDWSRVLSVGRVAARVIACFMNDTGLILYVYLPNEDEGSDESCLTYYISSFST